MAVAHYPSTFEPGEAFALSLDAADPLARFRDEFHIPLRPDGQPTIYLCGNSLGLQPRGARRYVEVELDAWAKLGVEGHFKEDSPWYSYHELFREPGARLVGARSGEVVMMNSLTVNLHLMLTTFYRPAGRRTRILTDTPAFPSDLYALQSQIEVHGLNPATELIQVQARAGEHLLRDEDIEAKITEHGEDLAVVMLNGVNYYTGQYFDLSRLAAAAHKHGCIIGLDLAHAAGNVPLQLHDWDIDFAVWCSYKYLNAGPGAVAGCFVHERHDNNPTLPRLAGWWGNDPTMRFRMHLEPKFVPRPGADGWQLSNPPILALAPLRASLELFERAGMESLRAKSVALTAYLDFLLDRTAAGRFTRITPREPARRGCQMSLLVNERPRELFAALHDQGVICDYREPNVIRLAAVPLYNRFHEVWQVANVLSQW
jgi:kynureninase